MAEKAQANLTVGGGAQSDIAATKDELGFDVYVDSIAAFLLSDATKPPLTMSIEGDWGAGKSTFMTLLARRLTDRAEQTEKIKPLVLHFDAWRNEKDEAVWGAFIGHLVRGLMRDRGYWASCVAELRLSWKRFNKYKALLPLLQVGVLWVMFLSLFALFMLSATHSDWDLALRIALGIIGLIGLATAARSALEKTIALVGSPWLATLGLLRFIETPDYAGKKQFSDVFAEDFPKILEAYVQPNRRVFVFVDDIDRAEPSHAAAIMRGLRVLMSTDQKQVVFILGLDRRKVAAGLAMTNAAALPYLYPGQTSDQLTLSGLLYGYEFLEKFINLPFAVPTPSGHDIERYLTSFSGVGVLPPTANKAMPSGRDLEVAFGTDSQPIRDVAAAVAPLFNNNPRRIKQFVNLYRLHAYIASETGILGEIGLQQLGVVIALLQRFPSLRETLESSPAALGPLLAGDMTLGLSAADVTLLRELDLGTRWPLARIDLSALLRTNPRVSRGVGASSASNPQTDAEANSGSRQSATTATANIVLEPATLQASATAKDNFGEQSYSEVESFQNPPATEEPIRPK